MDIISADNISYTVSDKKILDSVNFSIKEGSFCGVIGMNGSGKSTLMKILSGTEKPSSGTVSLMDKSLSAYSVKETAKRISCVFQSNDVVFDFSALQIVLMGRMPYQKALWQDSKEDMLIAEDCMKMTGVWHLRNRQIASLSGGERQRVFIARALAQKTPLMLMDEPVAALDIKHQYEIMNMLKEINQKHHTTIFIILHDLSLAYRFTDTVLALKEGRKMFFGPTNDVLSEENIEKIFEIRTEVNPHNGIIIRQ